MSYIRKTRDVWEIQINYGQGYEYECAEFSRAEAKRTLWEYRINCPQYPARIIKKRERITANPQEAANET